MSYLQSSEVGGTSGGGGSGTISGVVVVTFSMPTAGNENTITVPSTAKKFEMRSRFYGILKLYHVSAGTDFYTITPGNSYAQSDLQLTGNLLLYVVSNKTGDVLELVYWT